jgi:hypothetical protein
VANSHPCDGADGALTLGAEEDETYLDNRWFVSNLFTFPEPCCGDPRLGLADPVDNHFKVMG